MFNTRYENEPWYGPPDPKPSGRGRAVPNVDVYVFSEKKELELFVRERAHSKEKFVVYHVSSLGRATVTINVDTEIDDSNASK